MMMAKVNARAQLRKFYVVGRVVSLCAFLFLASCTERKTVIGVSQCSNDIWRQKVNQEIRIGQYQYKDVDVVITSADNDAMLQVRQIDSLVDEKVDLLVVAPTDSKIVTPAVEKAYRQGIPVILYDRKIATPCYTAYIGGDNVEIGREIARFLVDKLQGEGDVVEITGEPGSSPVVERHQGFKDVMRRYPSMRVVTLDGNWEVAGARDVMAKYLAKGFHVDAVFGHNDAEAEGAWQAAKAKGLERQMLFVGIDGLPGDNQGVDRVSRGVQTASYVYPTKGERIVPLAMDILQGKPYHRDNYMRSYLATEKNVGLIAMQYKEMEEKVKDLDNIYDSIDGYTSMYRKQRWIVGFSVAVVLLLLLLLFYVYRLYRAKSMKRKVTRGLLEMDEEITTDVMQKLDESERYFLDRFKKKVMERMGDANLKMDDLGSEMQLSKVQLYRKVKGLTGKTPAELLKEMRLQKAYVLLKQTDKTVSEIAVEVGFAVPSYFSSCFKKKFGINPVDVRKQTDVGKKIYPPK